MEADDEVALLFDPDGYGPLTVPLVNVRWALRLAVPAGAVPAAVAPDLLIAAGALHFDERTGCDARCPPLGSPGSRGAGGTRRCRPRQGTCRRDTA